jgi:hypothetical protein
VALGVAALTILGAVTAVLAAARFINDAPLDRVPALAASALGWGAGVLLGFAAAVQAQGRDQREGILALFRIRGASVRTYVWARVGGLTLLLAAVCVGGTLLTGLAATLVATRAGLALRTLHATGAAVAYAAAFSVVLGPLAMAALGARSRAGGYLFLVFVLVVPELLSPVTSALVPPGFRDLTSIPDALRVVRAALMPRSVDLWREAKALFALALVVAACIALVGRAAVRAAAQEAP